MSVKLTSFVLPSAGSSPRPGGMLFPGGTGVRGSSLQRIAVCIAALLCLCCSGHGEPSPTVQAGAGAPLTFRVFDFAGIDAEVMQTASAEAASIFRRAGLETLWESCRTNHEASSAAPVCPVTKDPLTLSVRILATAIPIPGFPEDTTFGFAFAPDSRGLASTAAVFWNRILDVARDKKVNAGRLLAAILVHEGGHLLLGQNSHYPLGVMSAVWDDREMYQIGQSALVFRPEQRGALRAAVDKRVEAGGPRRRPVRLAAAAFRAW